MSARLSIIPSIDADMSCPLQFIPFIRGVFGKKSFDSRLKLVLCCIFFSLRELNVVKEQAGPTS